MSLCYIDLSKVDFLTGEKTKQNTANCYIIKKPGKYKFPIVYGNSIKNGEDNKGSYENINFYDKDRSIKCPFIFRDLGIDEDNSVLSLKILWHNTKVNITNLKFDFMKQYIKFKIKVGKDFNFGGNVIIGLVINYKLIWTWHIWYYPFEIEPYDIGFHNKKKFIPKKYNDLISILPIPLGFCGLDYKEEKIRPIKCFYTYGDLIPKATSYPFDTDVKLKIYFTDWAREKQGSIQWSEKIITDPCPPGWKVPGIIVFKELGTVLCKNVEKSNPQNQSLILNCFRRNLNQLELICWSCSEMIECRLSDSSCIMLKVDSKIRNRIIIPSRDCTR